VVISIDYPDPGRGKHGEVKAGNRRQYTGDRRSGKASFYGIREFRIQNPEFRRQ